MFRFCCILIGNPTTLDFVRSSRKLCSFCAEPTNMRGLSHGQYHLWVARTIGLQPLPKPYHPLMVSRQKHGLIPQVQARERENQEKEGEGLTDTPFLVSF